MKALVTGGGGFLGGAIVRKLLKRGDSVRTFSRKRYQSLEDLHVDQFNGDLADAEAVLDACYGAEIVFHVAAKAGVWGPYQEFYDSNVTGSENVIRACRSHGIKKLVFTSSPSVVFDGKDMEGVDESVPYPQEYKAAYPKTKALAEQLILSNNDNNLATVALRPHLIWGPGDTHLVPGILSRASSLRRIGSEDKLVDFTYINDAANAHILAAERISNSSTIAGKAYFISQDCPMPLWDFVNRVLECAGHPPICGNVSARTAYLAGFILEKLYNLLKIRSEPRLTRFLAEELSTAHWFSIEAAKRDFGYSPDYTMDQGFDRLKEWLEGCNRFQPVPNSHPK